MTFIVLSLILFTLRGLSEYFTTSLGAAPGWRRPSWMTTDRDADWPGWMPFRDWYHAVQWVRDMTDHYGMITALHAVLIAFGVSLPTWCIVCMYTAPVALWTIGHGIGFSLFSRRYNVALSR